jgi:hypothetical protein
MLTGCVGDHEQAAWLVSIEGWIYGTWGIGWQWAGAGFNRVEARPRTINDAQQALLAADFRPLRSVE